jgi:predicted esterase
MTKVLAAALAMTLAAVAFAALQTPPDTDAIILTKGLAVSFPEEHCRAALPLDPVEYQLINGPWASPRPGDVLPLGSAPSSSPASSSASSAVSTATWEAVTANDKGWFEHQALRCGYVHLAYDSPAPKILLLEGFAHDWVYVNGEPRVGNRYGQSDTYESWQTRFDFSTLPVRLKRGRNEFLFKCARGRLKVRLRTPPRDLFFNGKDITSPDLVAGEEIATQAAIVVVNASDSPSRNIWISVSGAGLAPREIPLPEIRPLSVRKVAVPLQGRAPSVAGEWPAEITLLEKNGGSAVALDKAAIPLRVVASSEAHKRTYISSVDGSVQHYAVLPARASDRPAALVLTLHGAGVEALNQVRSYSRKTWAHIVAPTNRRPYGFNWEDWGRRDALEVLAEAQRRYATDPNRVYLTGHSMGGHGAWSVGGLFPDLFGAVGPSAGWISFWSYKVRQPADTGSLMGRMIMRPFLPSDPSVLLGNYRQHGVYIIHGDKDESVPVAESRWMAAELQKTHRDFVYHEQAGASHWWDVSPAAGVDCVDWPPLFDFFARHARPLRERVLEVDFATPCPGISASSNWLTIEAQTEPLELSSVKIRVSPAEGLFSGETKNVARLSFDVSSWEPRDSYVVELDGQRIAGVPRPKGEERLRLARRDGRWEASSRPPAALKGPHRSGLFKDAFNNRVVLVFGTRGTREENAWAEAKARYDAETFWYQGNGSIDVVRDADFVPDRFPDRNVILYGHAEMNSAWPALLGESPIQVRRGRLIVGTRTLQGRDLGCLFIRPRPSSDIASVGVVAGTGLAGMRLTDTLPYLYAGAAFPDLFCARPALLTRGLAGVEAAGFFGNDWRIETGEIVWK